MMSAHRAPARWVPVAAVLVAVVALLVTLTSREGPTLRVCADPNNLPFSNARLEGFARARKVIRVIERDDFRNSGGVEIAGRGDAAMRAALQRFEKRSQDSTAKTVEGRAPEVR